MNKYSKLFVGFAAVGLLASCSNDIDMPDPTPDQPVRPAGDVAYMKIQINPVGTRADGDPSTPVTPAEGYKDGSEAEHRVNDANFYFFNEAGTFVSKGSVINPGFVEDSPADTNIEYISSPNVLVLEDLTETGYPVYMLTVLNAPDGFEPKQGDTLEQVGLALQSSYAEKRGESGTETDHFVMSTSSYYTPEDVAGHNNTYYYCNKLETSDFYTSSSEAVEATKAVEVYVERLAAKVQVAVAAPDSKTVTYDGETFTIYKLEQTVGSTGNDQGTSSVAHNPVYIRILGWELNTTAKQSHMSKQLASEWDKTLVPTTPFKSWNNSTLFRSFWGMGSAYNATAFADTDLETYFDYKVIDKKNETNKGQNIIDLTDLKDLKLKKVGTTAFDENTDAAYCHENTNVPTKIMSGNDVLLDRATHVILVAQVTDENGKPVEMINHRGMLFEDNYFKNFILKDIDGGKNGLNYYWKTSETTFEQVSAADLNLVKPEDDKSLGGGTVELIDRNTSVDKKLYQKNSDGTYVEIANGKTELQGKINAAVGAKGVERFNKGLNLYYIPVEHAGVSGVTKGAEGFYGVVRNHWYQIAVSKFSKVGHGVFDPNSGVIVKPPHEDPRYYVGANINVLSWRLVSQKAEL